MKQNEIWLIDLDPTKGSELQKTRPGIIVNSNSLGKLPLKVIIPLTDWKDHFVSSPWMVRIVPSSKNGLSKISSADTFQIRSLSQQRLIKKIGTIEDEYSDEIKEAIRRILEI
jgi:mRNA interferase MazF